jgi:chromosome segregation ATPase
MLGDARREIDMLKSQLASALQTAVTKSEQSERDTKQMAALNALLNDMKNQVSLKSKLCDAADERREAAERRVIILETKVSSIDLFHWFWQHTNIRCFVDVDY